ncbi:ABC transporter ATP-binding protein [Xenophilus azovorans]|uniref:ABC transporter ATP-binding protein n=1 Tax=Xenophilus azovorans TaxID=151755 RepID=UPI00056EDA2B|nr:ABC transporter ATP-binding protein [Xenophilus azovorans]
MTFQVARLCARYGRLQVCHDIGLGADSGEFLVVLGPNGAGKSSLLGAIAGVVSASGSVLLDGEALDRCAADRRAFRGIALVPEGRRNLFMPLTVDENLRLGLRLLPKAERAGMRERLLGMFPILRHRPHQPAGMLSGGEQQMLAIAVALARRPSVLLLDEPTQGLAPVILGELIETIRELRHMGLSLVLAEQNHRFAAQLADRFVVLQSGEIVDQGAGHELQDPQRVAAAMIG